MALFDPLTPDRDALSKRPDNGVHGATKTSQHKPCCLRACHYRNLTENPDLVTTDRFRLWKGFCFWKVSTRQARHLLRDAVISWNNEKFSRFLDFLHNCSISIFSILNIITTV